MGLFSNFAPDPDGYKYNDDGSRKTDDEIKEAALEHIRNITADMNFTKNNRANYKEAKRLGLIDSSVSYSEFLDAHDSRPVSSNPNVNQADEDHPDAWMVD